MPLVGTRAMPGSPGFGGAPAFNAAPMDDLFRPPATEPALVSPAALPAPAPAGAAPPEPPLPFALPGMLPRPRAQQFRQTAAPAVQRRLARRIQSAGQCCYWQRGGQPGLLVPVGCARSCQSAGCSGSQQNAQRPSEYAQENRDGERRAGADGGTTWGQLYDAALVANVLPVSRLAEHRDAHARSHE